MQWSITEKKKQRKEKNTWGKITKEVKQQTKQRKETAKKRN
jgi:hypothetical protein